MDRKSNKCQDARKNEQRPKGSNYNKTKERAYFERIFRKKRYGFLQLIVEPTIKGKPDIGSKRFS